MRILIHLNHSKDKSYLADLNKKSSAERIQRILKLYPGDDVMQNLNSHLDQFIEIPPKHLSIAMQLATKTITPDYITEKLS